jgi:hypothetical protein
MAFSAEVGRKLRKQGNVLVIVLSPLHDRLNGHGYRLIEDWVIIGLGWALHKTRTLLNEQTG